MSGDPTLTGSDQSALQAQVQLPRSCSDGDDGVGGRFWFLELPLLAFPPSPPRRGREHIPRSQGAGPHGWPRKKGFFWALNPAGPNTQLARSQGPRVTLGFGQHLCIWVDPSHSAWTSPPAVGLSTRLLSSQGDLPETPLLRLPPELTPEATPTL